MSTLRDVKQIVRSILGDPDGDWATDAYLNPMVNHCYRLQITYLAKTCSPFMEKPVELLAVPAGTTDLTPWKTDPKKALFGLRNVFEVWWKQAGQTPNNYREADRKRPLPDVMPGTPMFRMAYEWRKNNLFVTPLNFAADLRVRGEFTPPPLKNEDDPVLVHEDLPDVLAEEVGACAVRERGNAGQMQTYQLAATEALDDIAAQLVGGDQAVTVRLGKATRRRRFY